MCTITGLAAPIVLSRRAIGLLHDRLSFSVHHSPACREAHLWLQPLPWLDIIAERPPALLLPFATGTALAASEVVVVGILGCRASRATAIDELTWNAIQAIALERAAARIAISGRAARTCRAVRFVAPTLEVGCRAVHALAAAAGVRVAPRRAVYAMAFARTFTTFSIASAWAALLAHCLHCLCLILALAAANA